MTTKSEHSFLHVRMPASMLKATKKMAKEEGISVSMLVRQFILTAVRKRAKK